MPACLSSVRPSIRPSVSLSVRLSISPSACLPARPYVYPWPAGSVCRAPELPDVHHEDLGQQALHGLAGRASRRPLGRKRREERLQQHKAERAPVLALPQRQRVVVVHESVCLSYRRRCRRRICFFLGGGANGTRGRVRRGGLLECCPPAHTSIQTDATSDACPCYRCGRCAWPWMGLTHPGGGLSVGMCITATAADSVECGR
jgi:hypothetical protein